jgi:hypothetical protein
MKIVPCRRRYVRADAGFAGVRETLEVCRAVDR